MVTHERLLSLVNYDPITGIFTWKISKGRAKAGSIAGHRQHDYLSFMIDGKRYLCHRLAMFYMTGKWPIDEIDHKNLIKTMNTWDNLRNADKVMNAANTMKRSHNTSGFKGAFFNRRNGKWLSQIRVNKKQIYLGNYETPELAHQAYCLAAMEFFGEYARTS
jgi:hypothetical protein